MAEHTPTPWSVKASTGQMDSKARFETGSKVLIFSDDCEHHPIADCSCNHSCRMPDEQEANAALIVNAVNNYERLVEALQSIIDMNDFVMADGDGARKVAAEALNAVVGTSQVSGGDHG